MSTPDEISARLRALEARQEAQRLIATYCFGMDQCDRDMTVSCFTQDVRFRRQDRSWGSGREQLWDLLAGQLVGMSPSWHASVSPVVVELRSDARWWTRHYGFVETGIDNARVVAGMTYHHRLREVDGRWLIDERALDFWYFAQANRLRTSYRDRDRVWWRGSAPPTFPQGFAGFRGFSEADWGPNELAPLTYHEEIS